MDKLSNQAIPNVSEAAAGLGAFLKIPSHPDPEVLAAYREGRLDIEAAERFERHLVVCDDCADFLAFTSNPVEAAREGVRDLEKERVWLAIKDDLFQGSRRDRSQAREELHRLRERVARGERRAKSWQRALVAAMVLVVPMGLGNLWQQSRYQDVIQPQITAQSADLSTSTTRGAQETETVISARGAFTVAFPVDAEPGQDLWVEISDSRGHVLWTGEGLRIDPYGYAMLGLHRRFFDHGAYRIQVFLSAAKMDPQAEYTFLLEVP